ncbi:MAG: hypothetical protein AAGI11_06120 [Pseudomonadota bacterium]
MPLPLLDIQDSNLQLWQGTEALSSPGYALLEGQSYAFGQAARAAARLQPRSINTRFWWQLSTEALQPALGPARHTADLVHAHLKDIHAKAGEPTELLLAVPGSASREQLALLLGIVQQCPFNAGGLVHRSVALGSSFAGSGPLYHLEIQLHQALLTELSRDAGEVALSRSTPLPGCGLLQLQERLVEIIAAAFIRQTRFDPRRKAESEQQLYDALPAALASLQTGPEAFIEIGGYRTRTTADELRDAGTRLFSALADSPIKAEGAEVIVDPLCGLLPGLLQALPAASSVLPADALFSAVQAAGERLVQRAEALSLVTRLPLADAPIAPVTPPPPPAEAPAAAPLPTPASHVLIGHQARPLQPDGLVLAPDCEIYQHGKGWYLRGAASRDARVNDAPAADQALGLGDSIALPGGEQALLIEVATDHGQT